MIRDTIFINEPIHGALERVISRLKASADVVMLDDPDYRNIERGAVYFVPSRGCVYRIESLGHEDFVFEPLPQRQHIFRCEAHNE